MKFFSRVIASFVLVVLPLAAQAQGFRVIPPSGEWVTDLGDLLSPVEERMLTEKLRSYSDTTSTQIVIVTLPSLDGVSAGDYAVELGRQWRVGQAGKNNGAVILVSRDDREAYIATGYGLEGSIPDAVASRIYRNILVPRFREGRFHAGLSEASDALIVAARGEFTADRDVAPRRQERGLDGATLFVLMIIAYFVLSGIRSGGGGHGGGRRVRRRHGIPPVIIWGGGGFGGGRGGFGGGGGLGGFGGGGGFGGFGGGGGSFGGGGAGGSW